MTREDRKFQIEIGRRARHAADKRRANELEREAIKAHEERDERISPIAAVKLAEALALAKKRGG